MKIPLPALFVLIFSCFAHGNPDEIAIGLSFSELIVKAIQNKDPEIASEAILALKRSSQIPKEHLSGALLLTLDAPGMTRQLLNAGAEPLVALGMLDARMQHTPEAAESLVLVYHHILSLFDLQAILNALRLTREEIEVMQLKESLSEYCPATLRERLVVRSQQVRPYRAAPRDLPAAAAAMPQEEAPNMPRLRRDESRSPSPHTAPGAAAVSE